MTDLAYSYAAGTSQAWEALEAEREADLQRAEAAAEAIRDRPHRFRPSPDFGPHYCACGIPASTHNQHTKEI